MKILKIILLIIAVLSIPSCYYGTWYTFVGNNEISPFLLAGNHAKLDIKDSMRIYPVYLRYDSLKLIKYQNIDTAKVINSAVLEYNDKIYVGEILKVENFDALLKFRKLPFSFIPHKHKHTIELTLIAKDSTKHLFKYESK